MNAAVHPPTIPTSQAVIRLRILSRKSRIGCVYLLVNFLLPEWSNFVVNEISIYVYILGL